MMENVLVAIALTLYISHLVKSNTHLVSEKRLIINIMASFFILVIPLIWGGIDKVISLDISKIYIAKFSFLYISCISVVLIHNLIPSLKITLFVRKLVIFSSVIAFSLFNYINFSAILLLVPIFVILILSLRKCQSFCLKQFHFLTQHIPLVENDKSQRLFIVAGSKVFITPTFLVLILSIFVSAFFSTTSSTWLNEQNYRYIHFLSTNVYGFFGVASFVELLCRYPSKYMIICLNIAYLLLLTVIFLYASFFVPVSVLFFSIMILFLFVISIFFMVKLQKTKE